MNEPYMTIYVNNKTLFFVKKVPLEEKQREIFCVGTDEVISDDFEEASRKLGNTILGILRLWHPDVFCNWNNDPKDGGAEMQILNDFDIAIHLIGKSVSDKTKSYVESIDALLREQSLRTKAGQSFFSESWPTIRAQLEKFT
jgi:hypothetical protein